jgi:hypothetical protein
MERNVKIGLARFSGRLNLVYFMLPAARLDIRCGPRAESGDQTLSGAAGYKDSM